jgi:hypothetical protein
VVNEEIEDRLRGVQINSAAEPAVSEATSARRQAAWRAKNRDVQESAALQQEEQEVERRWDELKQQWPYPTAKGKEPKDQTPIELRETHIYLRNQWAQIKKDHHLATLVRLRWSALGWPELELPSESAATELPQHQAESPQQRPPKKCHNCGSTEHLLKACPAPRRSGGVQKPAGNTRGTRGGSSVRSAVEAGIFFAAYQKSQRR